MLFQEIQDSPWFIVFGISLGASVLSMFIVVFLASVTADNRKIPILRRIFLISLSCVCVSALGGALVEHQQRDRTNASFSKQLMDEYHATSSRSFSSIRYDLSPTSGATAVFTRDGKDTQVLIRLVSRDSNQFIVSNKFTLAFTRLDDQSLYAKPSK